MSLSRLDLHRLRSPLGTLLAVTDDGILRALDFADFEGRMRRLLLRHYGAVPELVEREAPPRLAGAFAAYFAGRWSALDDIVVATAGSTFQRRVWAALREIPAGSTVTYGELARKLAMPTASRAVGLANAANPIALVVPCHRVIGGTGALTGYAGGVERKRWLLVHEGSLPAKLQTAPIASGEHNAG